MNNNSDFEQQFTQNIKASTAAQPAYDAVAPKMQGGSGKLSLIVAIALAAITLFETIALIITLSNYFAITTEDGLDDDSIGVEDSSNANYFFEDDTLVAFNITCTAEDGTYYAFDTDKKYEQHDPSSAIINSGTYTITNDSLISTKGNNKVLYYDGIDLADGLTIYSCEDVEMEPSAENANTEQ